MNLISISERYLAYDNIYDATGSNYNIISKSTNEMLLELVKEEIFKDYFYSDFNSIYLNGISDCENKEDIRKIRVKLRDTGFAILFLHSSAHAFSVTICKNKDSTYNIYIFNSGDGIYMHPYDKKTNLYGCLIVKKNVSYDILANFFENIEKYYLIQNNEKTLESIYLIIISSIFQINIETLEAYYFNDISDDIIYLNEQMTGNCSGRALFYPIIVYYKEIRGFSTEKSLELFQELKLLSSYYIYNKLINKISEEGITQCIISSYKTNYLNEIIELIKITQILNSHYYTSTFTLEKTKKDFITNIHDSIKSFDLNQVINYDYLNIAVNLPTNQDINTDEILKIQPLLVIDFDKLLNIKINSLDNYKLFLATCNKILTQIIEPQSFDSLINQLYYSILFKKALYKCYNNITFYVKNDTVTNADIPFIGENIELFFLNIGKIKKIQSHTVKLDLYLYFHNCVILFFYINLEIFPKSYKTRTLIKSYDAKFKKINFDNFDKNIVALRNYELYDVDKEQFYKYNSITYNNNNIFLNYKNILPTTSVEVNLDSIYIIFVRTFVQITLRYTSQPIISNYYSFMNYLLKITNDGFDVLNLEKFDEHIIDLNTWSSDLGRNQSILTGFEVMSKLFDETPNNNFYNSINEILHELSTNNTFKKENVESLLENLVIYHKMYNRTIDYEKIMQIIEKYNLTSELLILLVSNDTIHKRQLILELIFRYSSEYKIEIIKSNLNKIDHSLYRKYYYNEFKLSYIEYESEYKNLEEINKSDKLLNYLSIIMLNNLDIFQDILSNYCEFIKISVAQTNDNNLYIKKNNFYFTYKNQHAINFNSVNTQINLILKLDTETELETILFDQFTKLIKIFDMYKNYEIFNNRIFSYDENKDTFISDKYTLNLTTNSILYLDDKLVLNNYNLEEKISIFINNYLSFENKMYIDIYSTSKNIIIELVRYKLQITYENNDFFIDDYKIVTDFRDKYYIYKWIYGTNNILILKNNSLSLLKYKLYVFNNVIDENNKRVIYKKENLFWIMDDANNNLEFNIEDDYKYYVIDCNSNLLFLDVNLNDLNSIIVLCYTYIFYNKFNELFNLMNIINNELLNNNKNSLLLKFKKIIKTMTLNSPFQSIIKSQLLIKKYMSFVYKQNIYFKKYYNVTNVKPEYLVTLYPINKYIFDIAKKPNYLNINLKKQTPEKYSNLKDLLINKLNNNLGNNESFTFKGIDYAYSQIYLIYFKPFTAIESKIEILLMPSIDPFKITSYDILGYKSLSSTDELIKDSIDNSQVKNYFSIETTNILEKEEEINKLINDFITVNEKEELYDMSNLNVDIFINLLSRIENINIVENLNNISFSNNDLINKILEIFKNDYGFVFDSILIKTFNEVILLYNELKFIDESNHQIIIDEIARKLKNLNSYHKDVESIHIHMFEYIFGYFIKNEQNELINNIFNQFTKTPDNRNFYQLLMGLGKTSVVSPLLNIKLLNQSEKYVINILPESLIYQTYNILVSILKYIFNIDVILYKINRNTDISKITFEKNKIYIMSDSSYKTFLLINKEKNIDSYKDIELNAYVIMDEVDLINDTSKSEVNFPVGEKYIEEDLEKKINFIFDLLDIINIEYPKSSSILNYIEINPNVVTTKSDSYKQLLTYHFDSISKLIDNYLTSEEKLLINTDYRNFILNMDDLFNPSLNIDELRNIKNLYFIKGLLNDILPLVLKQKHRLNYGFVNDLDKKFYEYNFIAIPYFALDIPAYNYKDKSSSEFSNNYSKIIFTYLSFIANNTLYFREIDIKKLLDMIKTIYIIEIRTVAGLIKNFRPKILDIFDDLKNIYCIDKNNNINNTHYNHFDKNILIQVIKTKEGMTIYKRVLKFYLKQIFFEYIRINENVYNCSTVDVLSSSFSYYTSGFTGTPFFFIPYESVDKLEYNIVVNAEDDGKIVSGMTNKFLSPNIFYIDSNDEIINQIESYDTLIDIGSYFINYSSYEVVKKIKLLSLKKYYIFIDRDHIKKYITKDSDDIQIFNENTLPINGRFVYFDNGHITGQDIKLIPSAIGLVTINLENNYRDVAQGIFRLRKINYGQTINYIMSKKMKEIVPNVKMLVEWLYNKNIKILEDKKSLGLIQNIRREIKNIDNEFYKIKIENFSALTIKHFYYNTYDFILDNLIEQKDLLTIKYNKYKQEFIQKKLENKDLVEEIDFEKFDKSKILIEYLIEKYSFEKKTVNILQQQEQQQEQLQNILQESTNIKLMPEYSFSNVYYGIDTPIIRKNMGRSEVFFTKVNELIIIETVALHKIYKNTYKYPVIHIIRGIKENDQYNISYHFANYVDLVNNYFINPILYTTSKIYICDINGIEIFNNFTQTDKLNDITLKQIYNGSNNNSLYSIGYTSVSGLKKIREKMDDNYFITNINLKLPIKNFKSIMDYIKFYFSNYLNMIYTNFKIYESNIIKNENVFQQKINDYIDMTNLGVYENKKLQLLKHMLTINLKFKNYDNFYIQMMTLIDSVLDCADIENITFNSEQYYLLNLILGTNEIMINCNTLKCNQFEFYEIFKYFNKDINKFYKIYDKKLCDVVNSNHESKYDILKNINKVIVDNEKLIEMLDNIDINKLIIGANVDILIIEGLTQTIFKEIIMKKNINNNVLFVTTVLLNKKCNRLLPTYNFNLEELNIFINEFKNDIIVDENFIALFEDFESYEFPQDLLMHLITGDAARINLFKYIIKEKKYENTLRNIKLGEYYAYDFFTKNMLFISQHWHILKNLFETNLVPYQRLMEILMVPHNNFNTIFIKDDPNNIFDKNLVLTADAFVSFLNKIDISDTEYKILFDNLKITLTTEVTDRNKNDLYSIIKKKENLIEFFNVDIRNYVTGILDNITFNNVNLYDILKTIFKYSYEHKNIDQLKKFIEINDIDINLSPYKKGLINDAYYEDYKPILKYILELYSNFDFIDDESFKKIMLCDGTYLNKINEHIVKTLIKRNIIFLINLNIIDESNVNEIICKYELFKEKREKKIMITDIINSTHNLNLLNKILIHYKIEYSIISTKNFFQFMKNYGTANIKHDINKLINTVDKFIRFDEDNTEIKYTIEDLKELLLVYKINDKMFKYLISIMSMNNIIDRDALGIDPEIKYLKMITEKCTFLEEKISVLSPTLYGQEPYKKTYINYFLEIFKNNNYEQIFSLTKIFDYDFLKMLMNSSNIFIKEIDKYAENYSVLNFNLLKLLMTDMDKYDILSKFNNYRGDLSKCIELFNEIYFDKYNSLLKRICINYPIEEQNESEIHIILQTIINLESVEIDDELYYNPEINSSTLIIINNYLDRIVLPNNITDNNFYLNLFAKYDFTKSKYIFNVCRLSKFIKEKENWLDFLFDNKLTFNDNQTAFNIIANSDNMEEKSAKFIYIIKLTNDKNKFYDFANVVEKYRKTHSSKYYKYDSIIITLLKEYTKMLTQVHDNNFICNLIYYINKIIQDGYELNEKEKKLLNTHRKEILKPDTILILNSTSSSGSGSGYDFSHLMSHGGNIANTKYYDKYIKYKCKYLSLVKIIKDKS